MSVIKLNLFGGEVPSASDRAVPANAARTSRNLMAQSNEFRPIKDDLAVATIAASQNTLYRLERDATGALNTTMTSGWIVNDSVVNYVKGQIFDDVKERTYYAFNDPVTPRRAARAFDVDGNDRLLGVPSPVLKPTCTVMDSGPFTRVEMDRWEGTTLVPALVAAADAALYKNDALSRTSAAQVPVAGPYTAHGMVQSSPDFWNFKTSVLATTAYEVGLVDPRIQPNTNGANIEFRLTCLPYWPIVGTSPTPDDTGFRAALAALTNPRTSATLMSADLMTHMGAELVSMFDPLDEYIKPMRARLDSIATEFMAAIAFTLTTIPAAPTAPVRPTDPEFIGTEVDGVFTQVRSTEPSWVAYDLAYAQYLIDNPAYAEAVTKNTNERAARIATIAGLQAEALSLTQQIERRWNWLRDGLVLMYTKFADERNGDFDEDGSGSHVVALDPDRVTETRFYLITYVNDWGEESAPGPVSDMLTVDQYDAVVVSKPAIISGRNLVGWRLYRSNSGSTKTEFQLTQDSTSLIAHLTGGAFDYFELVTAETGYWDALKSEQLQEVIPSVTWLEPSPDLSGIVGMANGVMAGYFDNTVCFCEPYHPYAWPVEYQISIKHPVVGLASYGQSLFVGTRGTPYLISGQDSASMNPVELSGNQACLSARSMVAVGSGVLYASPDGICLADYNGVKVISQALFTREDWMARSPHTIVAALHDGAYCFFYNDGSANSVCYMLDFAAGKLTEVTVAGTISALYSDPITDTLYAIIGTSVMAMFSTGRRAGIYRTGTIKLPKHETMAWLQVDGDFSSSVTVRLYGDGALVHTATVPSITPMRLPAGRYLEYVIEIESTSRVTSVTLAGSTAELQSA